MCGLDEDVAACLLSCCGTSAELGSEEHPSPELHGPDEWTRSSCIQAGGFANGDNCRAPYALMSMGLLQTSSSNASIKGATLASDLSETA